MGLCLPCMGGAVKDVVETPDPEIKRRQLAEAAEKRQMEASSRGIKNAYSVEQKKKKQEEMEKRMTASGSGGGGLRHCLAAHLNNWQAEASACKPKGKG
ncbi:small VCP/p97-interacting protein [Amazona aestiva]|uniref:Small VCP/p97-interacting protein n=1 Tax=Amazona aestiva TaxID=12930 RepID=A0A0Q3M592_AMAAE|nr:small VCP/p97-interacting protein [Amazona aestiva]